LAFARRSIAGEAFGVVALEGIWVARRTEAETFATFALPRIDADARQAECAEGSGDTTSVAVLQKSDARAAATLEARLARAHAAKGVVGWKATFTATLRADAAGGAVGEISRRRVAECAKCCLIGVVVTRVLLQRGHACADLSQGGVRARRVDANVAADFSPFLADAQVAPERVAKEK
jgi:hypothetical protein